MPDDRQKKTAPRGERLMPALSRQGRGSHSMNSLAHQSQRSIVHRDATDCRDRERTLHTTPALRMARDDASWRTQRFRWMLLH